MIFNIPEIKINRIGGLLIIDAKCSCSSVSEVKKNWFENLWTTVGNKWGTKVVKESFEQKCEQAFVKRKLAKKIW